ncbi:hypothetical protein QYE76_009274 [Lolium multiflorum]|uniref:Transposase (putative) gypsy type domain-containing protein n=1 Tax=Lolium multiflorum TaxID=4521 RepID=A0AAD8TUY2_LOLMU|nr:hypothetical protein QYE76_009274 [Lolium multiflorum]
MGKKKGTAVPGSSSGVGKVSRDWCDSTISNRDVNKMRTLGFISSANDDICLPGSSSRPKPPKGFTVMFVAFLFRGLSLPAHEFLRSLLFFYGIQLWQLTPNSILHLSIFITLCEAFLGIDPHWGLWRKIFYVKRHNGNDGPPVIGGVGFAVRKEVYYLDYSMKESVQGWRQKWFYLRDVPAPGRRSNLPLFEDVLVATPKKSWRNILTAEESAIADQLFEQVVDLKNTGGLTMCGTEVVSVFLKRRVQPLMSRPHQLWMYVGKDDKSRVSSVDLSDEELRDEVRRLTRFSQKDNIVLTSARLPYDLKHLPAKASTVAQCYPPTPESGVELEDDDDNSDETEDAQHALEDSDVQGDEAPEDDAHTRDRRRGRINEDLMTTAESSPSGQDDDADETASPLLVAKSSTGFFAIEDDLDLSDDDDDEVPLAKRAKLFSGKTKSAKESNHSPTAPTPPSRTTVVRIPVSKVIPSAGAPISPAARDHLRKAIKVSADQVLEANKLTADARNENILLKDELKKLKKKMKDEQDARREAAIAADEKEGALRESITNLLNAADVPINRARKLREDSMYDALSLATNSNIQVLGILQKTKGALSKLFSMIFPKMKQNKTLGEMADTFFIDSSEAIELSKALPVDDDNCLVNLDPFKQLAVICANQLLKLVDEEKTKVVPEAAPGSSSPQP